MKYVGEFKNNLFNGSGVLTLPDGSYYEGQWTGEFGTYVFTNFRV